MHIMHVITAPTADACHFCGSVVTVASSQNITVRQRGEDPAAVQGLM